MYDQISFIYCDTVVFQKGYFIEVEKLLAGVMKNVVNDSSPSETTAKNGSAEASAKNGSAETSAKNGSAETNPKNGSAETSAKNGSAETTAKNGSAETTAKNGSAETSAKNGSASKTDDGGNGIVPSSDDGPDKTKRGDGENGSSDVKRENSEDESSVAMVRRMLTCLFWQICKKKRLCPLDHSISVFCNMTSSDLF